MGFLIKISGGITLFGAICIALSIIFELSEKIPDKYWKLFWAGVFFVALGVFLIIIRGSDQ